MSNQILDIKKYGAIDIGSNAVRLLISSTILQKGEPPKFKKLALIRVPIRLGLDAFNKGIISKQNAERLIDAMKAFKLLMKIHNIEKYAACATSAMRCANNGLEIIKKIKQQTNINIQLIDGKKEAKIISTMDITQATEEHLSHLYVDVGGGSTEFSVFEKNKQISSKSFKIGTVRLINEQKIDKRLWEEAKLWVKNHTKNIKNLVLVGSGGNINKIFKMSGQQQGRPLSYGYINAQYQFLKNMTYQERISKLDLNEDRADVIIPAAKIYLSAMKWSGARKIYVPKLGLSDGMIRNIFQGTL